MWRWWEGDLEGRHAWDQKCSDGFLNSEAQAIGYEVLLHFEVAGHDKRRAAVVGGRKRNRVLSAEEMQEDI